MLTHPFEVPESKKIRLIINTDAKNEADDQYAIVHALLTPRFNLKGIIAAHFGERRTTASMQESYDEIINLLDLMNMNDEVPVFKGTERSIPNENTPTMSEGAELIIREAMLDDRQPLYVIFLEQSQIWLQRTWLVRRLQAGLLPFGLEADLGLTVILSLT